MILSPMPIERVSGNASAGPINASHKTLLAGQLFSRGRSAEIKACPVDKSIKAKAAGIAGSAS